MYNYDKETGVNCFFVANGFGGGLTLLLDVEGRTLSQNHNFEDL